ncbi:dephospho-CoA kinase [Hyphobacterium sp. SN044]|uniref:dephospho-CoA kinase n=1 Tax=Hyphobacterium sp. SN044 TaxID=2912575 RepID=UPI001EEE294A|nr:dephospho-CoA kinase [Hyphobacterium sp. SN044]MCF8880455.1 dephospho-CoA kinase [Hyphobacterium sp. SN044]
MKLIGLTGSIGMGKSTTANMFAEEGVPVFDADAAVHALYAPGGDAVAEIEAAFPGTTGSQGVDRTRLSEALARDPAGFEKLEAIVHPLVAAARESFIEEARAAGCWAVLLDIPLLFESGREDAFDVLVVVSAPEDVQRERVLARPGMTVEKFEAIKARQTPDHEKRTRADFVVDSSKGLADAREQVKRIIAVLRPAANDGMN